MYTKNKVATLTRSHVSCLANEPSTKSTFGHEFLFSQGNWQPPGRCPIGLLTARFPVRAAPDIDSRVNPVRLLVSVRIMCLSLFTGLNLTIQSYEGHSILGPEICAGKVLDVWLGLQNYQPLFILRQDFPMSLDAFISNFLRLGFQPFHFSKIMPIGEESAIEVPAPFVKVAKSAHINLMAPRLHVSSFSMGKFVKKGTMYY